MNRASFDNFKYFMTEYYGFDCLFGVCTRHDQTCEDLLMTQPDYDVATMYFYIDYTEYYLPSSAWLSTNSDGGCTAMVNHLPNFDHMIILGTPFMKAFYTVFNYEMNTVEFYNCVGCVGDQYSYY